jgi:hypothetical protein
MAVLSFWAALTVLDGWATRIEKAYKDALRSISNKKISDPWTNMR